MVLRKCFWSDARPRRETVSTWASRTPLAGAEVWPSVPSPTSFSQMLLPLQSRT
ncbi:rCG23709 [Rattus norvegicus]|uniref:RCG23709 n=1 Tax=Rattus norvegicus TaxID=10116 RepID=A6JWB8_RAT|nr:rCG23709 [Rattus norvegicus]